MTDDPKLLRRFSAKVWVQGDGCWEWAAARINTGYGVINVGGRVLLAHRVSHELFIGPVPAGAEVRHSCDNPPCVNPQHLSLGSHADNMRDMAERGRARGGDHHAAKTHCPQGHPYDEANTYLAPAKGRANRQCRECKRVQLRASRASRKVG